MEHDFNAIANHDRVAAIMCMEGLVKIIRGEDPNWEGDRITNAEFACRHIYTTSPVIALELAEMLEADAGEYSECLGISPDRIQWFANRLKGQL